jgi:hypothetical protein
MTAEHGHDFPPVKDPNLAAVIVRLERLSDDFGEHRREIRQEMAEAHEETRDSLKKINDRLEPIEQTMTKAKGGWMVILGIGSLVSLALSVWELIVKQFGKA